MLSKAIVAQQYVPTITLGHSCSNIATRNYNSNRNNNNRNKIIEIKITEIRIPAGRTITPWSCGLPTS
jgi:hypothetical protein